MASGEASQAMEGEAIVGEDDFGGGGSGDAGTAVTAAGSRADVDQPGSGLRVEAFRCRHSGSVRAKEGGLESSAGVGTSGGGQGSGQGAGSER